MWLVSLQEQRLGESLHLAFGRANGSKYCVIILHLSDIHFRKSEVETTQDPNFHLRNEMLRDIESRCAEIGPPDVIVISGDVAFAGDASEYAYATKWLKTLCERIGGRMDSIFVVPGNHDVVRAKADQNLVQLIHDRIKKAENPVEELTRQLSDKDAAKLLYDSLASYNSFALQFFCDLKPRDRTRAKRDLKLNDGSTLRLWGLNTAVVSSRHDEPGSIFVDAASHQIIREAGVTNIVVAHHHLSWVGQSQMLEDHLNDVAPIQIFGHIHTNRIDQNRDYLRLTASAAQPDRHEAGWEPGYNILQLSVRGETNDRHLDVTTHVRVWQTAPGHFIAKMDRRKGDQLPVFQHSIALEAWRKPEDLAEDAASSGPEIGEVPGAVRYDDEEKTMNSLRELAIQFYGLSFSKKSEIAGRLALLEEEDMAQPDFERFRRVFLRAHERGQLEALEMAIRNAQEGNERE